MSCSKRLSNWDTILESHGRLDKSAVLKVLKVGLIKVCKIKPPGLLFLVVFISFYISRYHFPQIFRTPFLIIRKKDFGHEFSFLTDSLDPPAPPPLFPHSLNDRNPLSVMRAFC